MEQKILIVDDEAHIRMLIEQTLEESGRRRRGVFNSREWRNCTWILFKKKILNWCS
jgi:DNA-binding NtrC family response regulator